MFDIAFSELPLVKEETKEDKIVRSLTLGMGSGMELHAFFNHVQKDRHKGGIVQGAEGDFGIVVQVNATLTIRPSDHFNGR